MNFYHRGTGMPKTKTQAQKEIERKEAIEKKAAERLAEKTKRDEAYKQMKEQGIPASNIQVDQVDKKERRKQKKEQKLQKKSAAAPSSVEIAASENTNTLQESINDNDALVNATPTSITTPIPEEKPKSASVKSLASTIPTYVAVMQAISTPISSIASTRSLRETKKAIQAAITDVTAEALATIPAKRGRLVENHSTYCDGLRPILVLLAETLPEGCTIIPGKISTVKNIATRLELRSQRVKDENTYAFVARNGITAQEVTIVVADAKQIPQQLVRDEIDHILSSVSDKPLRSGGIEEVPLSSYNRASQAVRQGLWRETHQAQTVKAKERDKALKAETKVKAQARKLANKDISAATVQAYAKRDVDIISGVARTRNSMT
jgi:hypothetical protein